MSNRATTCVKIIATSIAITIGFQVSEANADKHLSDKKLGNLQEIVVAAKILTDERNTSLTRYCKELFPKPVFAPGITAAFIQSGRARFDDGTFTQGIVEGMEAAAQCFGINTEFHTSAEQDAQMASLAEGEFPPDIMLSIGFQRQAETVELSEKHPDIQFIGIDQGPDSFPSNYVAVSAKNWQVGYLAGVAAGLLSDVRKVGVIAGPEIPPVVEIADGFTNGVADVGPDIAVERIHLDSFIDPQLGARTAKDFANQGVDVIFGAAGQTGSSAILTAAAIDLNVVGVDLDQYFTTFSGGAEPGSDRLVTSAIKRMDVGTFLSIAAAVNGGIQTGILELDVANGGVSYSDFHEAVVTEDFQKTLEQARLDLISGAIKTPE